MMKRSGAFFTVVIVLAAVRYLARGYFDSLLTLEQTGALFFVLAFGMILRWRASLFFAFRKLTAPAVHARGCSGRSGGLKAGVRDSGLGNRE